jgi:hypothetical protein
LRIAKPPPAGLVVLASHGTTIDHNRDLSTLAGGLSRQREQ